MWVQTQIVPDAAPFLLSMKTLRSWRVVLDCAARRMWIPTQECWIEMLKNDDEHLLVPCATFTEGALKKYQKRTYREVSSFVSIEKYSGHNKAVAENHERPSQVEALFLTVSEPLASNRARGLGR